MVPSDGVAEPHREFWLLTQRTDVGTALPPKYWAERSAAWAASAASVAGCLPSFVRAPLPLAVQLLQHAAHPFGLLGGGETGRDGHHRRPVFPEGGHGPGPPGRSPHLHRSAVGSRQTLRPVAVRRASQDGAFDKYPQHVFAVAFQFGRADAGQRGQFLQ